MREAGVRVLLYCVSQIAVRYRKVITPLITFFSDFYFRIFVQVKHSPRLSLEVVHNVSLVPSCINCQYYHLQKLQDRVTVPIDKCPVCKSSLKVLGPIWNGDIDKLEFIDILLKELKSFNFKTNDKIYGLLVGKKDELESGTAPLGVYTHQMISEIKSNAPSLKTIM
jgi:tRNA (guanine26-N2/guanine27-N2)-dimethyltransferase